jgi:hypothetical protein
MNVSRSRRGVDGMLGVWTSGASVAEGFGSEAKTGTGFLVRIR